MEQALVFASIIVGVAISDLIVSLHRLLRSGVPVKWHWAQPWFAMLILLLNLMVWWSIVGEPKERLTIGEFVPTIIHLIMLALLTIAALPDRLSPEGVDLAAFYQSNRRYQWLLLALALAWSMAVDAAAAVREGAGLLEALLPELEDGVVLLVMVALAFVRRWWLVGAGMALLSLGPIGWLSRSIG
ncbi:hypothetical protein [Sphingomonas mesophila]|uniref:hypothetical protein n=1 Tax=Sphingomonas mesophila TaxID=2303576 RepID=UPI000E58E6DD|nr:hypothetical protein [Sphingomonas mesophila]